MSAFLLTVSAMLFSAGAMPTDSAVRETNKEQLLSGKPLIFKLKPEREDGRGYQLSYFVDVPLEVAWSFKTDFDNQLLLSNRFINSHRLVETNGENVVTETVYSSKPRAVFRWQTTVLPDQHLLRFVLLNPQACDQEYHYGYVKLEALDSGTHITQVAFFDFFGVSLWSNYPFGGGMSEFLNETAKWEQQAMRASRFRYE